MVSIVDGPFDNHILYKTLRIHGRPYLTPWKKRLLNLSDTLISLFVVGPLVIAYWNSTWATMDKYPQIYPPVNCFLFGALIHCCFCLLREPFNNKLNFLTSHSQEKPRARTIQSFVVKKIYTYIFSVGCIMHWYIYSLFFFLLDIMTHLILKYIFHAFKARGLGHLW